MERKKIDLKKYTEIKEEVKTKEQKITIDQFIENITDIRKEDQLPEDHEIWQETPIIEEYNPVKYWKKHFRNWGIKDIPDEIWKILIQQAQKDLTNKKQFLFNFEKNDVEQLKEKAIEIEQLAKQAVIQFEELSSQLLDRSINFTDYVYRMSFEEYEETKEDLIKKAQPEHSNIIENYKERTRDLTEIIKWLNILYKKHFNVPEQEELYRIRKRRYALKKEDGVEPWQTGFDSKIIKAITASELKKAIIKAGIPLIKELDDEIPYLRSFDGQYREDTLSYGFFDSDNDSVFPEGWLHFTIFEPGIFLGVSVHEEEKLKEIWWTWPDLHKDRVELLKEIYESIIQVGANYPLVNIFISELEKKLVILRIDERTTLCEKEIKTTSKDEKNIELAETEIKEIEKIWLSSEFFNTSLYEYFKRGFGFRRSYYETIEFLEDFYKNIHGVNIKLEKRIKNTKEYYIITISNNIRDKYNNYQVFFFGFQDVLTTFKTFDKIIRDFGYVRIDEIFDSESLDYLINKKSMKEEKIYKAISDYFLQFEIFNFDIDVALEQIAKKPVVKGMNWKQYVEEYSLSLAGKTQDEIALRYGVTQQAISGHRQKVKGELARITGEAYEKWLEDKYKAEPGVLEVLRKGGKGEADLIIFREDGLIEVINAKAYVFSLSRPTFTIPAKEYQPEIEEARELEKGEKDVIVYIDFFNLYNKERYPRIPIDHNKPPERVTIRFEDYLK